MTGLIDVSPAVVHAVKRQREMLKNPPRSPEEFLAALERQSLVQTVARLRQVLDLI